MGNIWQIFLVVTSVVVGVLLWLVKAAVLVGGKIISSPTEIGI